MTRPSTFEIRVVFEVDFGFGFGLLEGGACGGMGVERRARVHGAVVIIVVSFRFFIVGDGGT